MKDNALRTVITAVVIALILILAMMCLILPAVIRAMDQITEQSCRHAFEVTGYISERCADFIGK
ncbi:MAG: hypothetical protein V1685_06340 [Parcubacteria group bacterium]